MQQHLPRFLFVWKLFFENLIIEFFFIGFKRDFCWKLSSPKQDKRHQGFFLFFPTASCFPNHKKAHHQNPIASNCFGRVVSALQSFIANSRSDDFFFLSDFFCVFYLILAYFLSPTHLFLAKLPPPTYLPIS
jgi:hypothetical protein